MYYITKQHKKIISGLQKSNSLTMSHITIYGWRLGRSRGWLFWLGRNWTTRGGRTSATEGHHMTFFVLIMTSMVDSLMLMVTVKSMMSSMTIMMVIMGMMIMVIHMFRISMMATSSSSMMVLGSLLSIW